MKDFNSLSSQIITRLEQGLAPYLSYHDVAHTLYVLEKAKLIAGEEHLPEADRHLLYVACLYHDSGFLISNVSHEEKGCELAKTDLPEFGYSRSEIEIVCRMIMATRIPQTPHSHLEMVIADADLYHLGCDQYDYFADKLLREILHFNPNFTEEDWLNTQIKFLEAHRYHTRFATEKLEAPKQAVLKKLRRSLK